MKKPYLSCPVCGKTQMSLSARVSNYKPYLSKFQCPCCHARFRIPVWCSLVQVAALFLLALLGYSLAEWMGLSGDGPHLLLMLLVMLLGSEALGVLLAYKVPFQVMDDKTSPDWEFRTASLRSIQEVEVPAKGRDRKKRLRVWLYGALALVCLVVLPVLWILPFRAMPVLDGGDLRHAVEQQLLRDAEAGQFAVTYEDAASLRVDTLQLASDDALTYAHGSLVSDQGTFPFAVLLKKLPFSNRYLYDTRYRFDQLPTSLEPIKYVLMSYEVHLYGDVFSAQGILQELRIVLILAFPFLGLCRAVTKKFDRS